MALVTVITPTYNRADKLPVLFRALQNQSNGDFEWLIVDDGSKDKTENYINDFQAQVDFPVKFIKKTNGGKHTALNVGIKNISTELTLIVDSDDFLLPDAIEVIHQYYDKYKSNKEIGVFSFSKCIEYGKPVVTLPKEEYIDSYIKCRIRENRMGDMAEVFYTEILKKYPFPEFEGEKFLSEDVVWIQIGKEYKFVFSNKVIYQCEYLEGGLTANDKPYKFASPLGSMMRGKMLMLRECGVKANIRGAIIYNCYKKCVQVDVPTTVLCNNFWDKLLVFLMKPIGMIFYKKWRSNI